MNRMFLGFALVSSIVAGGIIGCGGNTTSTPATPAAASTTSASAASTVAVTLNEWAVKPSVASVKAGSVSFTVTNGGTTAHELAIVKSDLAADKLPVDGAAVGEKQVEVVGRTAQLDAGKSATQSFNLAAGKYVLICNLPAHYGQGMRIAFTVQ